MSVRLESLAEQWLPLCREYRPSAFWFWNARMEREQMRKVVCEMAANDIREFLIHPVHGMEMEYLSEEFFDCYRYALSLAKENNLKVWVYDEYGWPSGVAGGLLLREYPEHRGWYLHFEKDDQGGITARPQQSDRILDNTMGAPWTRSETGYLDTLSPEAVRRFIEMTHERIRAECGPLFEETVVGFFTDEPVCMMGSRNGWMGGWTTVGMPWTPKLPKLFAERFGYEIEPRYAELVGDGPSAVKRDYWGLVKDLYSQAYHGQIGDWCRAHGLKYTGHAGEDLPLMQVRFSGSVYKCLSEMDVPGIDHLGCGLEPDDRFVDHVLVPSIARHCGKDRVYCEAYGISSMDLRLGEMLRRAQMMAIYGINDLAIMGFQQSVDGIRKRTYWPPVFTQAPWWEFYSEYRDAATRSIGIVSLGKRVARYAILYPQNQLEQTDLFMADVASPDDPGSRMLRVLGEAVYDAKETFEYVFPEMLSQAEVKNGRIVFPNAEYEAILAPSDIAFFEESTQVLERIISSGGTVLRSETSALADEIRDATPSWSDKLSINCEGSSRVRVYSFNYADGELFALRNSTGQECKVEIASDESIAEWRPESGAVCRCGHSLRREIKPFDTLYFTLSSEPLGLPQEQDFNSLPISAEWIVTTERPNTARLSAIQFRHDTLGWLDAVDASIFLDTAGRSPIGIPAAFRGCTRIRMRGSFDCSSVPDQLGIVYEQKHLKRLSVNAASVDLSGSESLPMWDDSCRLVDVSSLAKLGANEIECDLVYEEFETSIRNDAFLAEWCMPSCDVFLAGNFRLLDGVLIADQGDANELPLDLARAGWSEYDGIVRFDATVDLDSETAEVVRGLQVQPQSEDCVELLVDGVTVGKQVSYPYRFEIRGIEPGKHKISLRITSTSANILANPSPWGLESVHWLCL